MRPFPLDTLIWIEITAIHTPIKEFLLRLSEQLFIKLDRPMLGLILDVGDG